MSHSRTDEGKKKIILLVEDNEDLRDALTDVLYILNYGVLPAKDGAEALSVFDAHQSTIDLIISDVTMPHMDGAELVRRLQKYSPLPKVLMMSGFRQSAKITPDVEEHIFGWLQKPVDMGTLAETIQQALSGG